MPKANDEHQFLFSFRGSELNSSDPFGDCFRHRRTLIWMNDKPVIDAFVVEQNGRQLVSLVGDEMIAGQIVSHVVIVVERTPTIVHTVVEKYWVEILFY